MATNTSKSVENPTVNDKELESQIKKAQAAFKSEKKVAVQIPATLESSLGKTLFIGVNGVHVNIPVDGKKYELPESFAKHVEQYLAILR